MFAAADAHWVNLQDAFALGARVCFFLQFRREDGSVVLEAHFLVEHVVASLRLANWFREGYVGVAGRSVGRGTSVQSWRDVLLLVSRRSLGRLIRNGGLLGCKNITRVSFFHCA